MIASRENPVSVFQDRTLQVRDASLAARIRDWGAICCSRIELVDESVIDSLEQFHWDSELRGGEK